MRYMYPPGERDYDSGTRARGLLTAGIVAGLVLAAFGLGMLIESTVMSGTNQVSGPVNAPTWEKGRYWVYAFTTPEVGYNISHMVVAGNDGVNYQVGVADRMDAWRHAVLNYNPMLGRVEMGGLMIYESGVPEPILLYPLTAGTSWMFSMYGVSDFTATVKSLQRVDLESGPTTLVHVSATSPSGHEMTYTYDSEARWLRSLVLENNKGTTLLEMTLVSYGLGYHGEVYFYRGTDLYDNTFESFRGSPELELYDSFLDQGHPSSGAFDYLIYHYEVSVGDESRVSLTLTDHASTVHLRKTFESGTAERTTGRVSSERGEWGLSMVLFGNSRMRLRIAGGIEYVWDVQ